MTDASITARRWPPQAPRAMARMNAAGSAPARPLPLDSETETRLQHEFSHGPKPPDVTGGARLGDREFFMMLAAFRATGGLARGDELARRLEHSDRGDAVTLARWVAQREVFCFEWRATHWLPMLQFDLRDLSMRPGPKQVYAELGGVFDGWALALWYAQPNAGLKNWRPVDLLGTQLSEVLGAARTDRCIAAG